MSRVADAVVDDTFVSVNLGACRNTNMDNRLPSIFGNSGIDIGHGRGRRATPSAATRIRLQARPGDGDRLRSFQHSPALPASCRGGLPSRHSENPRRALNHPGRPKGLLASTRFAYTYLMYDADLNSFNFIWYQRAFEGGLSVFQAVGKNDLVGRIRVAIAAEVRTGIVHADVLADHATAGFALSLVLL